MSFNPNYRNIFNSFTIGILFVNIFYAFFPQIDSEAIFLIGSLFIFLRITLKRWKNAKLSSIFITAAIIYFIPTNTLIRFQLRNNPNLAERIIDCREKNGEGNCWEEIQAEHENDILKKLDGRH